MDKKKITECLYITVNDLRSYIIQLQGVYIQVCEKIVFGIAIGNHDSAS